MQVYLQFIVLLLPSTITATTIEDSQYWHRIAQKELEKSLLYRWNTGKAKKRNNFCRRWHESRYHNSQ